MAVVVLVCATIIGFITFVMTCVAYANGAYYQRVEGSTETGAFGCRAIRIVQEILERKGEEIREDKKVSCPSEDIVLASLICVGISLLFTSITLVLQLFGKSDSRQYWVKPCLMILASIGMFVVVGLLISFLIAVGNSNFPCSFSDKYPRGPDGETVKTRAAPIATREDRQSCDSHTDYIYKKKLLIASLVFAILSAVVSIICICRVKESSANNETFAMADYDMSAQRYLQSQYGGAPGMRNQFQFGGGQTMSPNQMPTNQMPPNQMPPNQMPPNQLQHGGGQMMTPSQPQLPETQQ